MKRLTVVVLLVLGGGLIAGCEFDTEYSTSCSEWTDKYEDDKHTCDAVGLHTFMTESEYLSVLAGDNCIVGVPENEHVTQVLSCEEGT